jgi:two-component system, chemotaxis family, sensor kinase CheA
LATDATILVVDDDECARELLYLHLSNAGYEVLLAEDAIIAGHILLERRVALLVTDIEMPFMDGLELVQAIRNDPSVSSMPVIFVSSRWEHEGRARELGAVAFLRKPVPADQLLAAVAKHVFRDREPLTKHRLTETRSAD